MRLALATIGAVLLIGFGTIALLYAAGIGNYGCRDTAHGIECGNGR